MRKHTAKDIVEGFWKQVEKTPTCWNWTGYQTNNGYGRHYIGNQKKIVAHRFSYALQFGQIPDDSLVCHTCDNRLCVNPAHLFIGSQKDNMADMVSKERQSRGEGTYQSKLTDNDVLEIRQSPLRQFELARKYGVDKNTIRYIIRGETWKHLPLSECSKRL